MRHPDAQRRRRLQRLLGVRDDNSFAAAWKSFHESAAQRMLVLMGFLLPIYTSATAIAVAAVGIFWLLSLDFREKFRRVAGNEVAWLSVAMFLLYALAMTYSSASWSEAGGMLAKYRRFLYVPIYMTLFSSARIRRGSILAFQCGMVVTLVASYLMAFGLFETKRGDMADAAVFKNHITQNILMAFFIGLTLCLFPRSRRWQWIAGIVVALAAFNIFFMVDGRTGYLVLFGALLVLFVRRFGRRGLAWSLAGGMLAVAGLYLASGNFRERVNQVAVEARDYYVKDRKSPDSSIGERLYFYRVGLQIAADHPLVGAGTGSYATEFLRREGKHYGQVVGNPHSELLGILVQTGLLGMTVFLCWIVVQCRAVRDLPAALKPVAQMVIVTLLISGVFNTVLVDVTEASLYCYFVGLCFAPLARRRGQGRLAGRGRAEPGLTAGDAQPTTGDDAQQAANGARQTAAEENPPSGSSQEA